MEIPQAEAPISNATMVEYRHSLLCQGLVQYRHGARKRPAFAHVCGLSKAIRRIERGMEILVLVRDGYKVEGSASLDFLYDRMTESISEKEPDLVSMFKHDHPKHLGIVNLEDPKVSH
jgi:hypothetical protein